MIKEHFINFFVHKNISNGPWWWSACLASTPTIRVRIALTSTVFSVKFVLEKNENKQKKAGFAHF